MSSREQKKVGYTTSYFSLLTKILSVTQPGTLDNNYFGHVDKCRSKCKILKESLCVDVNLGFVYAILFKT
jgi:hypothetical protein